MQTDLLFWGVAFVFFLPLHLGLPLLFLLIEGGPGKMRGALPRVLLTGALSAVAAFAIALWLWSHNQWAAMAVIALAMAHPWLDIMLQRRKA